LLVPIVQNKKSNLKEERTSKQPVLHSGMHNKHKTNVQRCKTLNQSPYMTKIRCKAAVGKETQTGTARRDETRRVK